MRHLLLLTCLALLPLGCAIPEPIPLQKDTGAQWGPDGGGLRDAVRLDAPPAVPPDGGPNARDSNRADGMNLGLDGVKPDGVKLDGVKLDGVRLDATPGG